MPLPDATPDKRIYELLKTVDLENLTFSDLQAVGQSIYAEQGAEDELRRLVLLNLARLSVVGEWTGLTSAGGGGYLTYGAKPIERFTGAAGDMNMIIPAQSFDLNQITSAQWQVGMYLYPFMASDDATIDAFQVYVNNTNGTTTKVGVYTSLDNGLPDALQVSADLSMAATGLLTQTSLTGSLTMVKGTVYWMAFIVDLATQQLLATKYNNSTPLAPFPQVTVATGFHENLLYDATPTSFPATITLSDFDPVVDDYMTIGLRLA